MSLKDGNAYKESLKTLNHNVFAFGEKIENVVDHPLFSPHIKAAALTYDLAHDPSTEDLVTAISHLTGKKINRFTHIHQSTEDLVKKVKMLRMIAGKTGSCFQRCVGFDALNATYSVTYEMDEELGTDYHQRFRNYLEYIQDNDLMVAGAMTDPKGDRGLSPGNQKDPDMYVHIVEKNDKGIVIRGAKVHQTGIVNSHEMLVMPTIALGEGDKAYAVACALPTDAPGVVHIFGRQTNDERRLEGGEIDQGNAKYGTVGGEALTVLENVFVPWERVFMCEEYQFAGLLVERFASYHRQNYGGCKAGVSDVIIGATTAMAEYNGVAKASHVRDKIVEMVHLTETLYCGSIACSCEGAPTPSGAYFVNPLLANTVKQNVTRFIYEISRLSHDVSGGCIATLPSEKDLRHPEIGKYVEKYFKGVDSAPAEDRIRMARLVENMTGGTALVESMHGAGSPQAQRVMILRQANLGRKVKLAEKLAGIKPPKS
ncbi:vinylacetyl-CoA delta-isomerase /4-hydroxybutyryl-CoA dehydratase [Geothermobacter ehrlichii]|uniref:Vinylacetyl-CoA delta-isomerase /4-hydroxybutyryl-CoA dehydratase n=1 Tax=Geothermobacter ehrlichii TaxID=213224 RepID=A0A5D3WFX7_9BACT|nr:4-hydroxyphenylacetate 3-hydroxylase family protein [Geothermobacter ehrlichii]TYO95261.1 vinylacetyl-CoA delta-isomerase /4-hydroxybutyryl-CoA dehydratase [Geothermobacter ehrlichii]